MSHEVNDFFVICEYRAVCTVSEKAETIPWLLSKLGHEKKLKVFEETLRNVLIFRES